MTRALLMARLDPHLAVDTAPIADMLIAAARYHRTLAGVRGAHLGGGPMVIAKELEHWREFYLLVGTGGGTLVALLFVAVSLGPGFLTYARTEATRSYISPVVVHFAIVFFVSCIALIPTHKSSFFAAIIGATALIGFIVSCYSTIQILRHQDWSQAWADRIGYGALPALCYCALGVASWMAYREEHAALDVLAGTLIVLLLVNLRNAWDLMLDMVRRHAGD